MGKKLYVGGLSHGTGNGELEKMFEPYGTVQSAQVIMDRETGRSRASASSTWPATPRPRWPSPGSPTSRSMSVA